VVDAVCSLELEGAPRISAVDLKVEGVVPGPDPDSFQSAVSAAADLCPVANALCNNVRSGVAAELAQRISTREV
jgi:organic hydroperoxide reductase OsmC/OhrA